VAAACQSLMPLLQQGMQLYHTVRMRLWWGHTGGPWACLGQDWANTPGVSVALLLMSLAEQHWPAAVPNRKL